MTNESKVSTAIRAAKMYYYQNLTTGVIAKEMSISRSTVSRLLSFARDSGLIDIRIIEPTDQPDKQAFAALLYLNHTPTAHHFR